MKKKATDPTGCEFLGDRVIARDDVDFILGILGANGLVIKLSDANFEYSDVDEVLKERGPYPDSLDIEGLYQEKEFLRSRLAVMIGQRSVGVYASGDRVRVASYEILTRLRSTPDRVPGWLNPGNLFWFAIGGLNVVASSYWGILEVPLWGHVLAISSVVVWLASLVYSGRAKGFTLQRRHENFWQRRKDDLYLLVIGALAGGVVTYLLGLWRTDCPPPVS